MRERDVNCWADIARQSEEHVRLLEQLPSRWTLVEPTGNGLFRARARRRGASRDDPERHDFISARTPAELPTRIAEHDGARRR